MMNQGRKKKKEKKEKKEEEVEIRRVFGGKMREEAPE